MIPDPIENRNGITIKELRQWLALLPEASDDDEKPTIWLDDDGISNQIVSLYASSAGDVFLGIRDDPATY